MKKILLFTSILFFAFSLSTIKAQTLDSIITTTPIVCYGDLATVTAYMTQTIPGTPVQLLNYRYATPTFLTSYGSSGQTTGATQPFTGMIGANYRMFIVDSLAFAAAFPPPAGIPQSELQSPTHPSILGYLNFQVFGVPAVFVTETQITDNLCHGDCTADEKFAIIGGTPPYSITFNGITSVLGIGSLDTIYEDFCEGSYDVTIVDVNGCPTSPAITSFTISEPSKLIPDGSVISDYNGQDISCVGAADGSILAAVSGGTPGAPAYEYSIDGINFDPNPLFTNLVAGSYTITYRDGNGCDTTEIITLTDPPDLSGVAAVVNPVSCYQSDDGAIEFIVNSGNPGTPGYTYSIDAGISFQGPSLFSPLAGGLTYEIIVKDVNDCQDTASIFLAEPTELVFDTASLAYNGFGVSCFGASDGQITIFGVSGGVPTYEYSIDGGVSFTSQTIYPGLSPGTYIVQVRDATGCVEEKSMIITEPGTFSISAGVTLTYNGSDVSCYGACDGQVTVTPTNGVGSITYNMTSFLSQTSTVWNNVCGNISYTIDAIDANSCPATTTITLTEPLPWAYTADSIPETCGLANGQASINITQGGTGAINFLWDDPMSQATATATSLETGMYQVVVTDANGCGFSEDVFVEEVDITLDFDSVPPCNSGNDGEATVFPNGTPPYVITWATGATTNTITGLSPGFYVVTVVDDGGAGCSVTDSVEIPAMPIVDISLDMTIPQDTLVTCWGDPSSGITVTATGGTGPSTYQYYIPGIVPIPQASPTFFGLFAGTYTIFVEDFNGCLDSIDVTISQPDSLVFTTLSEDVDCHGDSTGMAYLDTIYGGTAPYSYLWSNGETNDTIFNLIAGSYTLTATDFNGCLMTPSFSTIAINEPPVLQSAITVLSDATCDSSQLLATGEMSVLASGGTPGYSYLWNTTSTSTSLNFLTPGMYTVTITDDNGCIVLDSAEILPGENPTLDVLIQHVSCYDSTNGMMFTSATGGAPPYSFTADGGVSFVPSGTPFGPTGEASYFITVVDDFGCTDADSVHVTRPDLIEISSLTQNVSCYDSTDGELQAIVTGGTNFGYSYIWIDAATTDTISTAQTIGSLIVGSYIVTVTDTNGCIGTSDSMKITQPDSLYISALTFTPVLCNGGNTGTATVVAAGGTPSYSYLWSTGDTTAIDSNLTQGNYLIQISDSNGCSRHANIDVTEPDSLTTIFDMDSVSCNGGNDGAAMVSVFGGVSPYTYLWDNGSTTNSANNLAGGYQIIAITDSNLCVLIDSVNILDPITLTIDSLIIEEITCHDANDGVIKVQITADANSHPVMYSKDNGLNMQSYFAFSNLSPNTYIMYVEDNKGCVVRDTVEIINPDSLYIDTTIFSHVQCYGTNTGSIQAINAIGGTPPYMYSVNGGVHHGNMAYFWGYFPAEYTVEVWDANNCGAWDKIIITEPSELDVTITTSNWYFNTYQIQCNGDASGFADITVNGGVGSYTYTVLDINGDTVVFTDTTHISGLEAGELTFVISDANGCIYTETIMYNEPSPIVHDFIATHITCSGWSNGSLTDVVSGGVGTATSYSYAWNTGDNTYSLSSLSPGIYTDTVVDEIGCISIDSYEIEETNVLALTVINSIDASCYSICDGVIEVEASGGKPNITPNGLSIYSYQWNDTLLQDETSALGLCVDSFSLSSIFTCIVIDAQGCTDTVTETIIQPEELIITASILDEISCNGGNDGKLTADVTGGTPGYDFIWNNNSTTSTINTVSEGHYTVSVTDDHGCMDTTAIYLPEPSALSIIIDTNLITNVSCFGFGDGTITAAVSGGSPFFPNFKYDYTFYNSFNMIVFSEQIDVSTATDLIPGIYTVKAEDENGCAITSSSYSITGPADPLSILVDSMDASCEENSGEATAFVLGGTPPYTYVWSNGGTTNPLTGLVHGLYTVNVTDANGCTISDETFVNGRQNIFLPGNVTSIDSTVCLGSTIFLEIEEKPELDYLWENGSTIADRWVMPTADTNLYTLTVSVPNCSETYTVTATIYLTDHVDPLLSTNPSSENDDPVHILPGESIDILSNNMDCDSYEWTWHDGDIESDTITLAAQREITDYPTATGTYTVEVDSAGCKGAGSILVAVGVIPYDAITPNADGFNDDWEIPGIEYYSNASIKVFNRWGALVYENSGGNYKGDKWNGTSTNGNVLPVGTYYYIIDLNNGDDAQTGPITIIR